jgi:hypothetical protein
MSKIKPEIGKWYELGTGNIARAERSDTFPKFPICVGGRHFNEFGEHVCDDVDIVSEVLITPVLPFELKAGGKYDTQKPDGSPGPVVELVDGVDRFKRLYPFQVCFNDWLHSVALDGLIETSRPDCLSGYRIVSEHVEPPKPTAIERLESLERDFSQLCSDSQHYAIYRQLAPIIADLKAGAT